MKSQYYTNLVELGRLFHGYALIKESALIQVVRYMGIWQNFLEVPRSFAA